MKILVQQSNCKFISNLDMLSDQHEILFTNIDHNIYQIEQKIKPDIYILSANKMSYEEIHFCQNNTDKKIFIYQNNDSNTYQAENITIINDTEVRFNYNPKRFRNMLLQEDRDIDYCYFLDECSSISESLQSMLYPNSTKRLFMFNNGNIQHPQNMGLISENEKAEILNRTKKYICDNLFYAIEAKLCGCEVVDTNLDPVKIEINDHPTYAEYMEKIL